MEADILVEDPLFLACTRPAMWRGVPLEAVAVNGMATSIVFVLAGNPAWLLIGVVLHHALRVLVARDVHLFGTLRLWADTKARARNTGYWGGSSVSPLPLRAARSTREVRIHA
ncbi:type IV secretion system protein VirB3 [Azospirillum melinis]|uniref:Type IV secretion system protein VirB3 n=1 Tax=Azospirillum melinis TaxID=328839 RepID=A0ABX2KL15_9PROT|nr:type IV secretion system protein VirB3 [Azospirillum melinis]MBP2307504.1 type IV secretion system protein VirB3 [Azospirillum melinis]NUB01949.1 type IV secretion system protein VirB3 [Azospirillum melinis]